ncbi:MAG: hypothetical protein ACRDN0_05625 [Trebonia sp.]
MLKVRTIWVVSAAALAALALAGGFSVVHPQHAQAQAAPPATTLGIWTSAEDSGSYSTISGQKPNVANDYLYWGTSFPTSFADQAEAAGATPFIELEPWQGVVQGQSGDCSYSSNFPAMTTIGSNGSAISSYLDSFGAAIASFGHPVIVTFAHEFNVSGQYPWSENDCEGTTAAQWISAWDAVRSDVDSSANGLASFMWVPNSATETGGSDTTYNPTPYWPGSSEVDMVGVDGYPDTTYGSSLGTFQGQFGLVFSQIHALTSLPIFISETNLAPLDGSGYETIPNFISDLCSDGGDGVLEWEDDGAPAMTSTQWTQLDNALASDCPSGGSTSGGGGGGGSGGTGTCATAAPTAAPTGFAATVKGSNVVVTWNAVPTASLYEISVNLPDGSQWRESVVTTNSATYDVVPETGVYTYKVLAINNVGLGPWSGVQSFPVTS